MDILLANRMYSCINKNLVSCSLSTDPCQNYGFMGSNCSCVCPPGTQGSNCETLVTPYNDIHLSPYSEIITTETTVSSPNYPSGSPVGEKYTKWIQAPTCKLVQLTFAAFSTYQRVTVSGDNICQYEGLEIRTSDMSDGTWYCGAEISPGQQITSASNEMILYFLTYIGGYTFAKWSATVAFIDEPNCSPASQTTTPPLPPAQTTAPPPPPLQTTTPPPPPVQTTTLPPPTVQTTTPRPPPVQTTTLPPQPPVQTTTPPPPPPVQTTTPSPPAQTTTPQPPPPPLQTTTPPPPSPPVQTTMPPAPPPVQTTTPPPPPPVQTTTPSPPAQTTTPQPPPPTVQTTKPPPPPPVQTTTLPQPPPVQTTTPPPPPPPVQTTTPSPPAQTTTPQPPPPPLQTTIPPPPSPPVQTTTPPPPPPVQTTTPSPPAQTTTPQPPPPTVQTTKPPPPPPVQTTTLPPPPPVQTTTPPPPPPPIQTTTPSPPAQTTTPQPPPPPLQTTIPPPPSPPVQTTTPPPPPTQTITPPPPPVQTTTPPPPPPVQTTTLPPHPILTTRPPESTTLSAQEPTTTESQLPGCRNVLYMGNTRFFSPNYPQKYPRDSICDYEERRSTPTLIVLKFLTFQLHKGDRLTVTHPYGPPFIFRGKKRRGYMEKIPGSFKATFTSDEALNRRGFAIEVRETTSNCHKTLSATSPDFVKTPKYPQKHPKNTICEWKITASPGRRIRVTIRVQRVNCKKNYVAVKSPTDDPFYDSSGVNRYCGKKVTRVVMSDSNVISVFYLGKIPDKGIKVSYEEI
ncbi:hypothetical protein SK128_024202 [Halocaridina rubra]|uniref:CUB domain-containing protein n=1 Tax=Halocaridina rubra TaxID=373956 RepID=A0AAN8WL54_HALRR